MEKLLSEYNINLIFKYFGLIAPRIAYTDYCYMYFYAYIHRKWRKEIYIHIYYMCVCVYFSIYYEQSVHKFVGDNFHHFKEKTAWPHKLILII